MRRSHEMGRPKTEGLVLTSVNVMREQLDDLDALLPALRTKRKQRVLTRSDLIREALDAYLAQHGAELAAAKRKR